VLAPPGDSESFSARVARWKGLLAGWCLAPIAFAWAESLNEALAAADMASVADAESSSSQSQSSSTSSKSQSQLDDLGKCTALLSIGGVGLDALRDGLAEFSAVRSLVRAAAGGRTALQAGSAQGTTSDEVPPARSSRPSRRVRGQYSGAES